jgi:hypothetical protein
VLGWTVHFAFPTINNCVVLPRLGMQSLPPSPSRRDLLGHALWSASGPSKREEQALPARTSSPELPNISLVVVVALDSIDSNPHCPIELCKETAQRVGYSHTQGHATKSAGSPPRSILTQLCASR